MKIGSDNIGSLFLGTEEFGKAYLGSELVYGHHTHNLPSGYKECEYVEVTCDYTESGPYIRTGVLASSELRVVAKIQIGLVTTDVWPMAFGVRSTDNNQRYECFGHNNYVQSCYIKGSAYGTDYRTTSTAPHTIDMNKYRLIYDGVEYPSSTQESWTSNLDFYIMALNNLDNSDGNGSFHSKYYYFQIYDGNTLVRDYIPAYQESSGDYGLYDLVNDTFVTTQVYKQYLTGKIIRVPDGKMSLLMSKSFIADNPTIQQLLQ